MDDYKKIPFDDPDLCVPDLDDFDQMKEFFLDPAPESRKNDQRLDPLRFAQRRRIA